jgi:plastocyanin
MRPSRPFARLTGLVLLTALVAACAMAPSAEPVETNRVDLPPSYRFVPDIISVPDGTNVTWTNHDNFSHSVRLLDDGGEVLTMAPGESVSFTFSGLGEHRYDCSFHPHDVSGVVIVSES